MRRAVCAAAIALAALLSACSQSAQNVPELRESVTVEYDAATVETGDVVSVTSYDAYVCATLVDVYFEKEFGTLGEVYVELGDRVEQGDTIAVLDRSALDAAVASAERAYQRREETLSRERRKAEINVELARIDLSEAQQSGDEQATALAELEVERLENEARQVEEMGELELEQLQREIDTARSELEGTVLTAPCSGEVVLLNVTAPGSRVTSETAVVRIADDSRLFVQYDGTDSISNSTLRDRTITAIVDGAELELEPVLYDPAEYARLVLAGTRPPVQFTFSEPVELEPGDFAEVLVYENEARGVLRIPVNALYTADSGAQYVYIVEGESRIYTEVSVGVRASSFVEITSGLEEGDVVFVRQ